MKLCPFFLTSSLYVFLFCNTASFGAAIPDIKANGSDGPVDVGEEDILLLTIALDANGSAGNDQEWGVAAHVPWGAWYYYQQPGQWVEAGSDLDEVRFAYQGPLESFSPVEILNTRGLPVGTYEVYFGVDATVNGQLDETLEYDHLTVGVQPASPFGFHPAGTTEPGIPGDSYQAAQDIGVRWTRQGVYAFWFLVQPSLDRPTYDFSSYDRQWSAVPPEIRILANIAPQGPLDEGRCLPDSWIPVDEDQYTAFVAATVERYDGDGVDDMPGLVNPIVYWQVGNEPNAERRSGFATLQRISYRAIKRACAHCTVLMGGVAGFPDGYLESFDTGYVPILEELGGEYMDRFDFHWYGEAAGDYRFRDPAAGVDVLEHLRATLTANGFPADLPIWITEMGAYSGKPANFGIATFTYQTERQQAGDYFRRFVYSLSRGVEKVLAAFGLMEGFQHDDGYFDHTGLIYDGRGSNDLGAGVKKLGYYSHKKMTEKLEGADWSTLETLHDGTDGDHLYLFRVEKAGRQLHIAWWDHFDEPVYIPGDTRPLTLSGLGGSSVTVTAVVPAADSGQAVTDYATAFTTDSYPVRDGMATILRVRTR